MCSQDTETIGGEDTWPGEYYGNLFDFTCHKSNNSEKVLISRFYEFMKVLTHLVYLMRVGEKAVQRQVALALAHLCSPEDQKSIFIDNNGMSFIYIWSLKTFLSN